MAGPTLNDRYELLERLGEGGMGVVYRARDRQHGREIALKALKNRLDRTGKERFAREFSAISAIDHPCCLRVFEFGETDEFPYFTMELFAGEPVTTLHGMPLDVIFEALYQTASAIDYVHTRRIVHRDVKPSNVLVRIERTPERSEIRVQVKLADFGLARFLSTPSSLTVDKGFIGTLKYCAPEQLSNQVVDHRADLYSLGLVCYEVLTGRYPFEQAAEAGIHSLVSAQTAQQSLQLRAFDHRIPADVEDMVSALLAKNPDERPNSALGLRRVLARLLGHPEVEDHARFEGSLIIGDWVQPHLVGRDAEVGGIRRQLHRALSPHGWSPVEWQADPVPSALFITAEPGIGKTRLLQEAVGIARTLGASVYEGRCFDGNLVPYQPFVEILRQILRELRFGVAFEPDRSGARSVAATERVPRGDATASGEASSTANSRASELGALVEQYTAEILRIAPDVSKWLPGEAFEQLDLSREMNYVLRALASFFIELAGLRGTILTIEDLQWADQGTLDLLRHLSAALFRQRELSTESNQRCSRLLICCTARQDQGRIKRFISQLQLERQAQLLTLPPFAQSQVADLVRALLGDVPNVTLEPFVESLHRWCRGNPFFIVETVRDCVIRKKLVRERGCFRFAQDFEGIADLPESVRHVWRARIGNLTPPAHQLLAVASVIGAVVEEGVLREVCSDMEDAPFLDALEEILATKTLAEITNGAFLGFTHDSIREDVYQGLSASRRRALHRKVGEVLEQRRERGLPCRPEVQAMHFSEGGVPDRAFRYLLDAGVSALKAYAVEDAIRHLTRAVEVIPESASNEDRFRLYQLLATAYSGAGQAALAIKAHSQSLQRTSDPALRADVTRRLGEILFRVGEFDQAMQRFDEAFGELGTHRPRLAFSAAAGVAGCFVRHYWPRWARWGRRLTGEKRERVQAERDVFKSAVEVWAQRSIVRSVHMHMSQLVRADKLNDPVALAEAYGQHALFMGIVSLRWLGRVAGKRAVEYAAQAGDPVVQSMATGLRGAAAYFAARLAEAERLLQEALAVLDRRGDSWFRQFFYHNLRHLYAVLGNTEKELACAKVELQIGETVHDPGAMCWGSYGMANALARSSQFDRAAEYMERALKHLLPPNIIVVPTALQTQGFVLLQSGDYERARQVLQQSRQMIDDNWAFLEYSIRAYPLLAESWLGPHWWDPKRQPASSELREIWRLSRKAVFWGRRFPNYLAHALRVRGRAAYATGRVRKARKCWTEAIAVAERIGAAYDLARCCLDRGRLGGPEADDDLQRGYRLLGELGAVIPPQEQTDSGNP